jgi:hypothetical protein
LRRKSPDYLPALYGLNPQTRNSSQTVSVSVSVSVSVCNWLNPRPGDAFTGFIRMEEDKAWKSTFADIVRAPMDQYLQE